MPPTFEPQSPPGIARPFAPQIGENDTSERIARALEHIAVVLSAIDHNLGVMVSRFPIERSREL